MDILDSQGFDISLHPGGESDFPNHLQGVNLHSHWIWNTYSWASKQHHLTPAAFASGGGEVFPWIRKPRKFATGWKVAYLCWKDVGYVERGLSYMERV